MKNKNLKRNILYILASLILAVMLSLPAYAAPDEAKCEIAFEADQNDTVTLDGKTVHTEHKGSGKFKLTFTQPGEYQYKVSNGKLEFTVDVYVLYDEQENLTAIPVIYEGDTEKINTINFKTETPEPPTQPDKPSGPSGGGGKVPELPTQTGDTNQSALYLAMLIGSMAAIIFAVCALYMGKRRERHEK